MVEVKVSEDGMSAMVLVIQEEGEEISLEVIRDYLKLEGVQAGIENAAIQELLDRKMFNMYVPVAKGKAPANGKDGYYEYFFDIEAENGGPVIREDGSVDYSMIFVNVNEGDLLARYYPETNGNFGYNVFAKALAPVKGSPAKPLALKGVKRNDNEFFAEISGRVVLKDSGLTVSNVLDIKEDVDYSTGNISFKGDIHVFGNVSGGVTVQAAGSVIVDGVIEDAKIIAGRDVVVGRGIHGQGTQPDEDANVSLDETDTVMVEAKGEIKAKFIDHAHVKAGDTVTIDYAVGAVIETEGMVIAQGSKGIIMGGKVMAVQGVDAVRLGNSAELLTEIKVGDCYILMEKIAGLRQQLREVEQCLTEFGDDENGEEAETLKARVKLVKQRLMEMERTVRERQQSPVIIRQIIYPNVKLVFGDFLAPNIVGRKESEYRKINGRILSRTIGGFTEKELSMGVIIAQENDVMMSEKCKVLVVDDDSRLLRTVLQILEDHYQVAVAKNGRSARKYLEGNMADLILLDYMMPEENGVEVLKSLRAWDKTKDIPVVFLTGLDDKRKILECLSLRPAGYILKPVDQAKLLAKIRAIIGEK